jgi:predicted XRE-type DNA-binding protein
MSTNVFADAGYAADDATIMAIRSDLAMRIAEYLERSPLNQVAAARQLGVPQPTISKIVNGRIENLSIELLLRMLVRANVPIVIQSGSAVKDAGAYVGVGKSLATVGMAATPSTQMPYPIRPEDFRFVSVGQPGGTDNEPHRDVPWKFVSLSSKASGRVSE